LLAGCGDGVFCHKPEGADVTRTLLLNDMTGIELMVSGDVTLRQDSVQSITVTGASNIIDLVETDVVGGVWKIDYDGCTRGRSDLHFEIALPTLRYVGIAGSGDVAMATPFNELDDLHLSIAGSGNIRGEVYATSLKSEIAGSGDITVSGTATSADHNIAGSGNIRCFDLATDHSSARISGSGNVELSATTTLDATISGSGDIYYKGTPAVTTHISGSGNVVHRN
jgi:hypothetical protein